MSDDFLQFSEQFKAISGLDLSHYNQAQILRRLSVLQQKKRLLTLFDLLAALKQDQDLLQECMKRLTINVTEFFRDQAYWDILKNYISNLSRLRLPLRLWSAGCATGEEAYSLTWLTSTLLPKNCWELTASDLDSSALTTARAGLYRSKSLKGINANLAPLIFDKVDEDLYAVKDRIRNRVRFFKHDLLQDSYPDNLDIILCRNVIIYFKDSTKKSVIAKLAQSLRPNGLLFVGGSEQIMHPEDYSLVNENVYFYRKQAK